MANDSEQPVLLNGKRVSVLPVKDLKVELEIRRLSTLGKKPELVERLLEAVKAERRSNEEAEDLNEDMEVDSEETSTKSKKGKKKSVAVKNRRKKASTTKHDDSTESMETDVVGGAPVEERAEATINNNATVAPTAKSSFSHLRRRTSDVRRSLIRKFNLEDVEGIPVSNSKPSNKKVEEGSIRKQEKEFMSDDDETMEVNEPEPDRQRRSGTVTLADTPVARERRPSSLSVAGRTPLSDSETPKSRRKTNFTSETASSLARKRSLNINEKDVKTPGRPASVERQTKSQSRTEEARPVANRASVLSGKPPIAPKRSEMHLNEASKRNRRTIKKDNKKPEPGSIAAMFAQQHTKLVNKMPTLEEQRDKMNKRHQELMASVPKVAQRLATPKSVTVVRRSAGRNLQPIPRFNINAAVDEINFQFGKVAPANIADVQREYVTPTPTRRVQPRKERTELPVRFAIDVKQRTKNQCKLTLPVDSTMINYLATPKDRQPDKVPARRGYTPHRGKVEFVDTSKLSDRELELALENGIVKTTVTKRSSNAKIMDQARKTNRENLLDIRRKLGK